jgi:hypothetical protein
MIAVEVKCPRKQLTSEQICFLYNLNAAGGIGIKAESVEDLFEDERI